jgi:putative transposase
MSRFRLLPTPEQEQAVVAHCRDARFVWSLAVEQQRYWQPGRKARGYVEQCAQLTAARAEYGWLRAGSQTVQQQALRDFVQAMRNFFAGTHRRPAWRKAGVHEGFRQVGMKRHHVERLNHHFGRVWVPKVGWLRFRLSRPVPEGVKSYRVTRDRAGRWHVSFAHVPDPITGPGDCSVVGNRKSQAVFECEACTAGRCNADVNAARNIAAGRAVTARGDLADGRSVIREPQLSTPAA